MNRIKSYFSDWTIFEKCWLALSVVIMVTMSVLSKDQPLALLSGLAGIISVVLCAKGKILNYAFGLIQAVTYVFICFQAHIYGEVMYNIFMVPMITIGFLTWNKHMSDDHEEVQARNLTLRGWVILLLCMVVSVTGYCIILKLLHGNFVLVDATSTVLSVIATILMITRFSEQWLVWILVNVASVILWLMALESSDPGGVTLVVMWSAYLFNSIYGYVNWRRMARENR